MARIGYKNLIKSNLEVICDEIIVEMSGGQRLNNLCINNEVISIKRVELRQLSKLLEWYNLTEDYSYATGFNIPVTLEELGKRYFEALRSEADIFLGIHAVSDDSLIGMLKCHLSKNVLWIYSFIIDKDYQNMGHGTMTLSLFLNHLKACSGVREIFLSVAGENSKGRSFWLKNGFREVKTARSERLLNGKECMVIIMKKNL